MTDDVAREPVQAPAQTSQSGEQPRRSRRRGKRSKNKSPEAQVNPTQVAPAAGRPPEKPAPSGGQPRGRKSPPLKSGFLPFNDGLDRFVCPECLRFLPQEFPVQHRRGTATIPLREVDRRDGELLLCNGLHSGPCLWPDGVIVDSAAPEASEANEPPNGQRPEPDMAETAADGQETTAGASPVDDTAATPAPDKAPKVMRLTGTR